jgi:hypothetical protein
LESLGDFPRPEDGHFTVLSGECEVLQFPDESVPQLKLLYLSKQKKFDEAKKLVEKQNRFIIDINVYTSIHEYKIEAYCYKRHVYLNNYFFICMYVCMNEYTLTVQLNSARILAKITELSGFGELATLTGSFY